MKVFKESQRFNQWWLMVMGILVIVVMSHSFFKKFKDLEGELNNEDWVSLIVSAFVIVCVILLFVFMNLKIKIDEKGIAYQFLPFHLTERLIPWNDLTKCFVRKYSPITEYGGWGIRGFKRKGFWDFRNKGMAFNVKGDMGIQLIFKDGGKLLIGTQEPEKAEKTIQNYLSKMDMGLH